MSDKQLVKYVKKRQKHVKLVTKPNGERHWVDVKLKNFVTNTAKDWGNWSTVPFAGQIAEKAADYGYEGSRYLVKQAYESNRRHDRVNTELIRTLARNRNYRFQERDEESNGRNRKTPSQRISDAYWNDPDAGFDMDVSPKKLMGASTGVFKGRFNSARKLRESIESKHQRKGFHVTDETFGLITDPDCVYVWHSTYHLERLVRVIVGSTVRELFHMAGYSINNSGNNIGLSFTTGGLISFRIRWQRINPITGIVGTVATADIPLAPSFLGVLNLVGGYATFWTEYFQNTTPDIPYTLQLLQCDTHGATSTSQDYRTVASMDLQSCKIKIDVHSSICIQNRTSGATATGVAIGESDRVDNQPLEGFMYEFRHSDPRLKNPDAGLAPLNRIRREGISFSNANQLGQPLQEPFVPKLFQNCRKSVKIRLNPGDLKEQNIYHTFSGSLESVAKKLRTCLAQIITTNTFISGVQGKCQMFILEEQIRSNAANVITINYERQVKIGATCTNVFKNVPLLTELSSGEQNF